MKKKPVSLLVVVLFLGGCLPPQTSSTAPRGGSGGGGSGIPRKDLDVKNMTNLQQIGLAYQTAQIMGSVKGPADLKASLEGHDALLKSARDKQPYEIVWRVDPSKISEGSSNVLLAWEKTAAEDGTRWVLYANCSTVAKLKEQEFEKTPKAKPNS